MEKLQYICVILFLFFGNHLHGQDKSDKENIRFSISERIRFTTIDNAISLDNDADIWTFARFRTYAGVEYFPAENIDLKFELGNESRIWFSPAAKVSRFDEIFVNQFFVKWDNILGLPASVKLGRQDIMFDEGFVCFDGQPLEGSRSVYFNALRSEYRFSKKTKVSSFISYNPRTDNVLPIINESNPPRLLEEQSNIGFAVYLQQRTKMGHHSLYYFNKHNLEHAVYAVESKINHFGLRSEFQLYKYLTIVGEGGIQFGHSGENNLLAFGGHAHIDYNLTSIFSFLDMISLGGFYLSGDDPQTSRAEGWDPLWSRWPKWSESYIYTLIQEYNGRVGFWSNIASLNVSLSSAFSKAVSFKISYHHLYALEDNTSDFCSGSGYTRGDLFSFKTGYKIDGHWSGHFVLETFSPGDFYFDDAAGYNWMRFELMYRL